MTHPHKRSCLELKDRKAPQHRALPSQGRGALDSVPENNVGQDKMQVLPWLQAVQLPPPCQLFTTPKYNLQTPNLRTAPSTAGARHNM